MSHRHRTTHTLSYAAAATAVGCLHASCSSPRSASAGAAPASPTVRKTAPTNAALRISGTYGGEPEKPTFRLLKLHGSIAWYYSWPSGGPHEPIYITPWKGAFGDDVRLINDRVTTLVEDKKPFIVPPAAAKSSFYANQLLAARWKQAAKALQALTPEDEFVLMGYSHGSQPSRR